MSTIMIRNEKETDYSVVEEITRKAFYNIYVPGATEHYLVHIMRQHEDFIPELDLLTSSCWRDRLPAHRMINRRFTGDTD